MAEDLGKKLTAGLMAGAIFSISLSLMNGLSTYVMKDGATLQEWAAAAVGGQ